MNKGIAIHKRQVEVDGKVYTFFVYNDGTFSTPRAANGRVVRVELQERVYAAHKAAQTQTAAA